MHWSEVAEEMGFKGVMAGPLVRSSYRAGRLWATAMRKWGREIPAHLLAPRRGRRVAPPARRRRRWWPAPRAPYPEHHGTQQGRRRSSAPQEKKQGRLSQIRDVYRVSKEADPAIGWFMLLSFLVVFGVLLVIGFLVKLPWIFGIFGVLFGVLAATIIMSRRAERAAYSQIEGQAGAAGAALTSIRRGWYTDREPVAADVARPGDINSAAMVYRALGRPGVVLVGEGPTARVQKLLAAEKKRSSASRPASRSRRCASASGEDEVPLPQAREQGPAPQAADHQGRDVSASTSASSRSAACALRCRPASTRCAPAWTGRPCAASEPARALHLSCT